MSYYYDVCHDKQQITPTFNKPLLSPNPHHDMRQKCPDMETEHSQAALQETGEQTSLTDMLNQWEEDCRNCHPITPITCVTDCKIWKLKNEFRKLCEKMKNPNFMTNLLNTLKNKRRLQILEIISKERHSMVRLQQELKKLGYYHSQKTITEEYIAPLIEVGLAKENQNSYQATIFGSRLKELIKNFHDIENALPSHSECYEEVTLSALLNAPKTYEDLKGIIQARSVARVLKRLQTAELIDAGKENDYVFYFRTKRDSSKAKFSPTEKRVYENIPPEGVSGRSLAEKARISLRRTYKYLRRLKGKKLVFTRKRPKSYALTDKGLQIALMLERIRNLAMQALATATQLVRNTEVQRMLVPDTSCAVHEKKGKKVISITPLQRIEQN